MFHFKYDICLIEFVVKDLTYNLLPGTGGHMQICIYHLQHLNQWKKTGKLDIDIDIDTDSV